MYDDKYENFFLNIVAGRSRFAEFASFTGTALQAEGLPPLLAALAQPFAKALADFVGDVATRTGDGGAAQGGTRTEDEVWVDIKTFVTSTDKTLIQPAYFDKPADLLIYYPNKLSGLTQAPKKLRLPRLMAYAKAVQTYNKAIGTKVGPQAATLLAQYKAATTTKEAAGSRVKNAIATLTPGQEALCKQLWAAHTTGLYVYQENPDLAAALFDFSLLPKNRTTPPKKPPLG